MNYPFDSDYQDALDNIPAPGGNGCHGALLGVATRGIRCGKDDETIFYDIRQHIPNGGRIVEDREIEQAIQRAHLDTEPWWKNSDTEHPVFDSRSSLAPESRDFINWLERGGKSELLYSLAHKGTGGIPSKWLNVQTPHYDDTLFADTIRLLEARFYPDDLVFIGKRSTKAEGIKSAAEWIDLFRNIQSGWNSLPEYKRSEEIDHYSDLFPFIIPNPLTGEESLCQDQLNKTCRGDNCVKEFRTIILEFDQLSIENQYATLRGLRHFEVDIQAVVFSGNKSCHAWLSCPGIASLEDWQKKIKGEIFPLLAVLGADTACSNPSRLTRLPGVKRADKNLWQKLLFLNNGSEEL